MNLNMEMVLLVIIAFIMGWFLSSNLIEGADTQGENDLNDKGCPKQNPTCKPGEPSCSFKCVVGNYLDMVKKLCDDHPKLSKIPPFKNICKELPQ